MARISKAQRAEREELAAQGLKLCPKCKEIKEHKEFNKHKATWDGLQSRCRICQSDKDAAYRKNNQEYARNYYEAATCSFDGCDRPHEARGYCNGHYQQFRKGNPLKPIIKRGKHTNTVCLETDCGRPASKKGLCEAHYQKHRLPVTSCSFEGCGSRVRNLTNQLCVGHYRQMLYTGELKSLVMARTAVGREAESYLREQGLRTCGKCGEVKPVGEFNKATRNAAGLDSACKPCRSEEKLLRNYGIDKAVWDNLFALQERRCTICGTTDPGSTGWTTDHDHDHGGGHRSVRGILCHGCNVGLGYFKDDPAALRAAADYLEHGSVYWLTDEDEAVLAEHLAN